MVLTYDYKPLQAETATPAPTTAVIPPVRGAVAKIANPAKTCHHLHLPPCKPSICKLFIFFIAIKF